MKWDPANTDAAKANRAAKAETLATWCRALGLGADTVRGWDEVTRRRAARAADVNPPRAQSPTWDLVAAELADEQLPITDLAMPVHRAWCSGCRTCNPLEHQEHAEDLNVPAVHATQHEPPSDLPVAPNLVDHQPKGWAQLAALGPVEPTRPCSVAAPDGEACGAPAVIRMMTTAGRDVWRCAGHPPAPGEWGHRLDLSPTPCTAPARCYCGRCDVDAPVPVVAAAGV